MLEFPQDLRMTHIKASDCMVEAISTQHWKVSKSFKKYPSKQGDCMVEALSLQAWEIFKSFKKYPSKQGACDCMVEAISLQVWEGWQLCYIFLSHFLLELAKTWLAKGPNCWFILMIRQKGLPEIRCRGFYSQRENWEHKVVRCLRISQD